MTNETRKLGIHQQEMLDFARIHLTDGKIHSLAKDSTTQRVAKSLEAMDLIKINEFNQFTLNS